MLRCHDKVSISQINSVRIRIPLVDNLDPWVRRFKVKVKSQARVRLNKHERLE